MRYPILIAALGVSLLAQGPPNCTGIALDVDARCSCLKDPNSQVCAMAKAGFYDGGMKIKPLSLGTPTTVTGARPATPAPKPAQPQKARLVPLAHKDYLRFLQPNARLVAGFDFEKIFSSPELVASLLSQGEGEGAKGQVMDAMKEMDHLWFSYASPSDFVLLMTGKFERGVAAGMFYAQGVQPVFLGDAHAMMIGPEPSVQAALARLARPAVTGGWVTRRARELSREHETWVVNEPAAADQAPLELQAIRQFSLGVQLTGEAGIDGEVVADSEAGAEQISAWADQMKTTLRGKDGVGALDSLNVERIGKMLRFAAKDDGKLEGEPGKAALNSEFGVDLYSVIMAGLPGVPARTVASEKLQAVTAGMKREDLLGLLGRPLSVSSIQGLDLPRETWTYQVPFGKQFTVRLDGGVVTVTPHP